MKHFMVLLAVMVFVQSAQGAVSYCGLFKAGASSDTVSVESGQKEKKCLKPAQWVLDEYKVNKAGMIITGVIALPLVIFGSLKLVQNIAGLNILGTLFSAAGLAAGGIALSEYDKKQWEYELTKELFAPWVSQDESDIIDELNDSYLVQIDSKNKQGRVLLNSQKIQQVFDRYHLFQKEENVDSVVRQLKQIVDGLK